MLANYRGSHVDARGFSFVTCFRQHLKMFRKSEVILLASERLGTRYCNCFRLPDLLLEEQSAFARNR